MAVTKDESLLAMSARLQPQIEQAEREIDAHLVAAGGQGPVHIDINKLPTLDALSYHETKVALLALRKRYAEVGWEMTDTSNQRDGWFLSFR